MANSVIIVESPAKARTISKFVGKKYHVLASLGHIRDLPKSKLGVDVDDDFAPQYVTLKTKGKVLQDLKDSVKRADEVFLAPDPDREGEAIAWHLAEYLKKGSKATFRRMEFHEITKQAIQESLKHPRELDQNRVDAQQARRVLDRLVGYKVSPFLWTTVRYGLSAGRVQSVALRIIVDREREVEAFQSTEYWTIDGYFKTARNEVLKARLVKLAGEKPVVGSEEAANALLLDLKQRAYKISELKVQSRKRNPAPPFITSTLQQEAFRKLHYTAKRTMAVAQGLYEGIDLGPEGTIGLISYMRTDSTRISGEAMDEVRGHILAAYGERYVPEKPRFFSTRKGAQDAHEAVRPTSALRTPESMKKHLSAEQHKLYTLIWNRFVASQMNPAESEVTTVEVQGGDALFRAAGSRPVFDGFTRLYEEKVASEESRAVNATARVDEEEEEQERPLPEVAKGETAQWQKAQPDQHFTEPPPRYTEASLVKALEERGIGRPSTYATIVSTILTRDYVARDKGRLVPTDLGKTVTDLLVQNFADIFNVDFTARMEENLDKVEEGQNPWVSVVREFYQPFREDLERAEGNKDLLKEQVQTETDIPCEQCGSLLVRKFGRNGPFLACPKYPECKYTRPLSDDEQPQPAGRDCPACAKPMFVRTGRFGRFVACQDYPTCKTTASVSTGVRCPKEADGTLVEKRTRKGKMFFACDQYPKCSYALWNRPIPVACPGCGNPFMVEKETKAKGPHYQCPECKTESRSETIETEQLLKQAEAGR